jgi:hypothetical protein
MALLRIEAPIGSGGDVGNIKRKVYEVQGTGVSDVEEGFLAGPARFQAGEFIEGAPLAGREDARSALNDRLGVQGFFYILDRIDPEVVKTCRSVHCRKETNEAFHEGNERRKVKNGIARKMVGLKFVKIKKAPEKVRRR